MSLQTRLRLAVASALLALTASCDSTTAPSRTPTEAAGVYVLESVSGRGPASGSFILTADGRAERRVRYASSVSSAEYVAVGTYELDATGISFALREDSGRSSYVWLVRGEWSGARFLIRHPDPADGPDIVETYQPL